LTDATIRDAVDHDNFGADRSEIRTGIEPLERDDLGAIRFKIIDVIDTQYFGRDAGGTQVSGPRRPAREGACPPRHRRVLRTPMRFRLGLRGKTVACRFRRLARLACLGVPLVVPMAPDPAAAGVRLLDPGDAMLPIAPFPEVTPGFLARVPSSLETVRVSVVDGQAIQLEGLAQRAAAFEVVPATSNPDLVWNARSGTVSVGGQVIAYAVDRTSLPAAIDRTAAARSLEKAVAGRPQAIRLVSGRTPARKGDRVEIEVGDVAERAVILLGIAGNGTVRMLYPRGGDERVVRDRVFRLPLEIREPVGLDLIVAVSASRPLDALEQGLQQISHHRSAGEIPKLLSLAVPADARIGIVALASAP
jgi:hypothetical protein